MIGEKQRLISLYINQREGKKHKDRGSMIKGGENIQANN